MPHRDSPTLPYSAALDGVRGVAILLVLLFHGEGRLLPGGYLGVSSFFTLSGFLITSLLLLEREGSGRIDLARFWARRLRRLMPAALLGIALAAAFVLVAGTPSQRARFRWDGIAALAYGANFRAIGAGQSYWEMFSRPSPLEHYWSLSIEEQFYLVYPLLLLGVARFVGGTRRTLRVVLLVLLLASTATMVGLATSGASSARLYFGTDTRAGEFLIGALLATFLARAGELHAWRGRGHSLVTFACATFVIAAVALADEDSPFLYRGGFALYALATAGLLNAALASGVVQSVLAWGPLRLLGRVSYGAYVYHWPIDLYLDPERTGLAGAPLLVLQLASSIALAGVSWVLLERPIHSASGRLGRRAAVALPVALASVLALLVVAGGSPGIDWEQALEDARMPEVGAKAPEGPVRILVLGDSLAANIGTGLNAWATQTGARAVVWNAAQYGCGLLRQPDEETRRDVESNRCLNWTTFWGEEIARFEPDVVVICSGVWDLRPLPVGARDALRPGDAAFDRELLATYRRAVDIAASRGARVVWVNTPCVGPDPGRNPLGRTGALQPQNIAHLDGTLLPALAASRPALAIFDLFRMVCPGGRFVRSLDGVRTTRADFLHLTPRAARDVARALVAETFPVVSGTDLAGARRPAHRRRN